MNNVFDGMDNDSKLLSRKLKCEILREIRERGFMSFSRYMELALYHVELGYYRNGSIKFGEAGDFVTAPEISPLFSACLANQCTQVFSMLPQRTIIEFGAGSGVLAGELMLSLSKLGQPVDEYIIIELSAELKQRQQHVIQQKYASWTSKVKWADRMPEDMTGVVIANEVLDAMPVDVFSMEEDLHECGVVEDRGDLVWGKRLLIDGALKAAIDNLDLRVDGEYRSEINLFLRPWIKSVSRCLKQGVLLLIDYGFPRHEYYHSQRSQGTVMCHYRHRAFDDPLSYPGIHDITAHVDFTAVAEAASDEGMDVMGFANQAGFLMSCGLQTLLTRGNTVAEYQQAQQVKYLTLPSEMGELFKVMACGRGISMELLGFRHNDQLHRL